MVRSGLFALKKLSQSVSDEINFAFHLMKRSFDG